MIGIYAIANTINGKMYIGQSVNITRRWKDHRVASRCKSRADYSYPLYRAIRKYGLENFEFIILETCEEARLNEREIYWMTYYNVLEEGYNIAEGGGQPACHCQKLTEEDANEIRKLLLTTNLSQTDIANKFEVSQVLVSLINRGENWHSEDFEYPLRKKRRGGQSTKTSPRRYCIDCGVEISEKATRCRDCYYKNKNHRKVPLENRPFRNELKYLIRTMPFTQIGKKYDVSDNAVRKWCKTVKLPTKKREIDAYTDEEWNLI